MAEIFRVVIKVVNKMHNYYMKSRIRLGATLSFKIFSFISGIYTLGDVLCLLKAVEEKGLIIGVDGEIEVRLKLK